MFVLKLFENICNLYPSCYWNSQSTLKSKSMCLPTIPKLKRQAMIAEELNQDLENVSIWLSANKLTLNKTKTEYMIIGSNRRVNNINIMPNIFIKDREINRVKTTKSLGIMIDETLSWNAQVDQITKKVNSGLSILKRLRDILDYQTLIKIYLSIIQIHNYNTRQSEFNFALPKPKTNFMKKSFAYRGAETWNNLSADIKSKTSISTFKNSLTASV